MTEPADPDLAVVIPAYGNRRHLQDIVDALDRQSRAVREIVISHSGPDDPTGGLHSIRTPINYLHSAERLFSGAARNRGVAFTAARWLAFLDDDVIPGPGWIGTISDLLSQDPGHCCHVGSIDVDTPGGYWGMSLWFVEFGSVHPYLPPGARQGGASANMFLHRSLFDRCGGFPENAAYGVDIQFMARCREIGGNTRFIPQACVAHRNVAGYSNSAGHAWRLGQASARVRQIAPLRAGIAVKYPALCALLLPARLGLIIYRVARWGRDHRLPLLYHLPGIVLILLAWTLGFYRRAVD